MRAEGNRTGVSFDDRVPAGDADAEMVQPVLVQLLAVRNQQDEVQVEIRPDEGGVAMRPFFRPDPEQPGVEAGALGEVADPDTGVKFL